MPFRNKIFITIIIIISSLVLPHTLPYLLSHLLTRTGAGLSIGMQVEDFHCTRIEGIAGPSKHFVRRRFHHEAFIHGAVLHFEFDSNERNA